MLEAAIYIYLCWGSRMYMLLEALGDEDALDEELDRGHLEIWRDVVSFWRAVVGLWDCQSVIKEYIRNRKQKPTSILLLQKIGGGETGESQDVPSVITMNHHSSICTTAGTTRLCST